MSFNASITNWTFVPTPATPTEAWCMRYVNSIANIPTGACHNSAVGLKCQYCHLLHQPCIMVGFSPPAVCPFSDIAQVDPRLDNQVNAVVLAPTVAARAVALPAFRSARNALGRQINLGTAPPTVPRAPPPPPPPPSRVEALFAWALGTFARVTQRILGLWRGFLRRVQLVLHAFMPGRLMLPGLLRNYDRQLSTVDLHSFTPCRQKFSRHREPRSWMPREM